jgi:hypothetical protein
MPAWISLMVLSTHSTVHPLAATHIVLAISVVAQVVAGDVLVIAGAIHPVAAEAVAAVINAA